MTDATGQPYFVWDQRMTLDEFERGLRDGDPDVRARYVARLMRDARPDDVFAFVSLDEIGTLWTAVAPLLGRNRPFWQWLLARWGVVAEGGDAR